MADPWTAVLLLFHDHEWEHALLEWALGTPAFLIGAQGGAPAREARLKRLQEAGHGHADAEHAAGWPFGADVAHHLAEQGESLLRIGERRAPFAARDHVAGKVDQCSVDADRRDMEADRESAFGIDRERRRRMAAAARGLADAADESLQLELAGDVGNGLDGEADLLGNVGARDRGRESDRLEDDPPVIGSAELLVRPAQRHAASLAEGPTLARVIFKSNGFQK